MAVSLKNRKLRKLIAEVQSRLDEIEDLLVDAVHSQDFASVNWFGTSYTFTATQAAAVRCLWQAWENGTPAVRQETIQEASASSNDFKDLFRGHPAWGNMIRSGDKRGTYQLWEPENGR